MSGRGLEFTKLFLMNILDLVSAYLNRFENKPFSKAITVKKYAADRTALIIPRPNSAQNKFLESMVLHIVSVELAQPS